MSTLHFSIEVKSILEKYGWFEGREVCTFEATLQLSNCLGIEINEAAEAVLRELNNLHILVNNYSIDFDVKEVVTWFDRDEVPYLHKLIHRHLCPVAYYSRGIILMVADDYSIVGLSTQRMLFYHYSTLNDALFCWFFPDSDHVDAVELDEHKFPPLAF